jgi:hypothetical protein
MKSSKLDRATKERKRKRNWKTRLTHILRDVSKTVCTDLLNLMVCYRYAESLVHNSRVKRYLLKHHPEELEQMEQIIADISLDGGSGLSSVRLP